VDSESPSKKKISARRPQTVRQGGSNTTRHEKQVFVHILRCINFY
jgi:hypothetical protein